jgi:hypothetical protein
MSQQQDRFLDRTLTDILAQLRLQRIDALLLECVKDHPQEFNNREIDKDFLYNLVSPYIVVPTNSHLPKRQLKACVEGLCEDFLYANRALVLNNVGPVEFWTIILE